MITKGVKMVRGELLTAMINILHAASTSPSATPLANPRLRVPPAVHPLPGFVLAILKHPAFRSDATLTPDQRIIALERVRNLGHTPLLTYLVPMLYSVPPPEVCMCVCVCVCVRVCMRVHADVLHL
jgi:protein transport protein SEC24